MESEPVEIDARDDVSKNPLARRVRRRPTVANVRFVHAPGVVQTLEGPVGHGSGAAIVTGAAGEQWPVERARFEASYEAIASTRMGEDGPYRHVASLAWARCSPQPFQLRLRDGRGTLHGNAGDWLVQYAPGDLAVVSASIFDATYEIV
jgi:hypothetical protein